MSKTTGSDPAAGLSAVSVSTNDARRGVWIEDDDEAAPAAEGAETKELYVESPEGAKRMRVAQDCNGIDLPLSQDSKEA